MYDIRFNFINDNPYDYKKGLNSKDVLNNFHLLKDYIESNSDEFTDFNYITNSRAFGSVDKISKYMDYTIQDNLQDCLPLYRDVCEFFAKLNGRLPNVLSEDLINFAIQGVSTIDPNVITQTIESDITNSEIEITPNEMIDEVSTILPPTFNQDNDEVKYTTTDDMAPYNLMSGKLLNYNDVCRITLNISRTQLSVVMTKDENMVFMEEREKTKLRQELDKYMKNIDIQKNFTNIDLDQLNLKQLQYYTNQCKDVFESLKVIDAAQKGLEVFDFGYHTFFPNGIRISKRKVVKLDGTAAAFNEVLFDRNSTAPISFKNVVDKYNIHVSDEMNTFMNIIGKLVKRIKIEDIPIDEDSSEEVNKNNNSQEAVTEEVSSDDVSSASESE